MVKHIVIWKLKDEHNGLNKNELAKQAKAKLLALKKVIPELIKIEVGINEIHPDKNSDLVLSTDFNSFDDLASYAVHPEHLKVGAFIKELVLERACVDYEY